jgi:muramoyltetrapeptide carboxypeptidase
MFTGALAMTMGAKKLNAFDAGTAIGGAPLQIRDKELIKAPKLNKGDCIGIVAPGTSVSDPDDLHKAREAAEYFGLKYKMGDYVTKGSGYKSRTAEERLSDVHKMFADEEVKAVICIRGGYGSPQLLDRIDYDLIRKNPKIFMGYSDITAMLLAINRYAGLVTFHGPVMLSAFSNYTIDYFKKALFSSEPIGKAENSKEKNSFREVFPIRTVVGGKAEGMLIGGNLSLICNTLGTPYEIDTKDKIFFIEDVGEEPYRIDRMLTQLRLAGKFHQAAGIVVGYCKGCDGDVLQPSKVWDYSLGEIIDNIIGKVGKPCIHGLTIGHTSNQITLPIGVKASLDADDKSLTILESGVI